jgi:predicted transcriptional regulator
MARKRERTDIIFDMLVSIQQKGGRIKPTHLMYRANLTHHQMKLYLEELIGNELVEKVNDRGYQYLIITNSGSKILEKLRQMKEFGKTFGL